ncbi:hypothetical protein [Metabacillus iocasae]|uniref:Uncharacterized membrane protein (DUF485 family) n=1 Tax=Priestia iocasae TaxID=2291674 RepID=A0ABS2QYY1_9BACI|nr:hypothetical protein [Metabacillus iocasae]MBM7704699.1 uncharacterized membrane protein (DUF485 family) [Metabacillus iocasae]
MPHYVPFLVLVIISMMIFGIVLWLKRDSTLFILFLFMTGLAYFLEYIILILFNSYRYNPDLMKEDYFDNILGSVTSQAFAFPIMAVVIAAYQLRLPYIVIISIMFMGIEELFLSWDVYTHNWWKTPYTGVFMTIGFLISKIWYEWLHERFSMFIHTLTLYFSMISINATIMFVIVATFQTHWLQLDFFQNSTRDHINLNTLYVFLLTAIYVCLILKQASILWIGSVIVLIRIFDWMLIQVGVLSLAPWNSFFVIVLLDIFVLLITAVLHRFIIKSCYGTNPLKEISFQKYYKDV